MSSQRSKAGAARRDSYHHGALREALIEATEALLAERGAEGFSLREVARRSGVSPAAPAHHFGDAQGLLLAVATLAFDGLTQALREGDARGGADPQARLREQGLGYVAFALRYPGRFGLMFRTGSAGLVRDEAFVASARAAYGLLEDGIRLLFGLPPGAPLAGADALAVVATWSVVHGFAHLALAGEFDTLGPCEPGEPRRQQVRRDAVLREMLAPLLERHLQGLLVLRRAT